jgi:hypothetical protein
MIDLLGLDKEKIRALTVFDDAVFCLHLPGDCSGAGLTEVIQILRSAGIERVIIGGR